jgi:hemoglobin-like flavoprotein
MNVSQSVEAVLSHGESVIRRFYDKFLTSHPEAAAYFEGIDLDHQSALLTMALIMIDLHHSKSLPAAERYLRVLGHRHHEYGIGADMFPKFGRSLLDTLAEFHGAAWDEALAREWGKAFDRAAATMLDGYQHPLTV